MTPALGPSRAARLFPNSGTSATTLPSPPKTPSSSSRSACGSLHYVPSPSFVSRTLYFPITLSSILDVKFTLLVINPRLAELCIPSAALFLASHIQSHVNVAASRSLKSARTRFCQQYRTPRLLPRYSHLRVSFSINFISLSSPAYTPQQTKFRAACLVIVLRSISGDMRVRWVNGDGCGIKEGEWKGECWKQKRSRRTSEGEEALLVRKTAAVQLRIGGVLTGKGEGSGGGGGGGSGGGERRANSLSCRKPAWHSGNFLLRRRCQHLRRCLG